MAKQAMDLQAIVAAVMAAQGQQPTAPLVSALTAVATVPVKASERKDRPKGVAIVKSSTKGTIMFLIDGKNYGTIGRKSGTMTSQDTAKLFAQAMGLNYDAIPTVEVETDEAYAARSVR